jgi:thioredoxin reductase (NADPH)
MLDNTYDLVIIGGGPSGLTAAIYTARAAIKTLLLAGDPAGGQLMLTTEVENFPGFPQGIDGPQLISTLRSQAEKFGTITKDENVTKITGSVEKGFEITTESGSVYKSKVIIVATGANAKWLGLESEQRLRGKGVSACATCDGFFFKGKEVVVVGAGDVAMEDATFLTKFATKVHIFVRGTKENMRASRFMQEKAFTNQKIEFHFNTEIKEILGVDHVQGVKVINNQTKEETLIPEIGGVFVAIGHKPATDFLKGVVELDDIGYIKVTDNTKTSQAGIFAAGDAADFRYRQAITAAGMGCMAALDAEKYLASIEK